MVARHPSGDSDKQKLPFTGAKPRGRCSKNGEKIYCIELRAVCLHRFKTIINYSRCSKSGCRLDSRQIIGVRSLSVAELRVQLLSHATWKKQHEPCYFRELVFYSRSPEHSTKETLIPIPLLRRCRWVHEIAGCVSKRRAQTKN